MIGEFNTAQPTGPGAGSTGGSGNKLLMLLVVGVVLYFGYKYLIKKPAEKEKQAQ